MERSTLTRREASALAIVGAMAAAVLPPAVVAAQTADDAELLECGKQAEALEEALTRAAALSQPTWRALDEWDRANRGRRLTDAEVFEAHCRIEREIPLPSPSCDEISDAIYAPVSRIIALPAKTSAGLAVKAQRVQREFYQLWQKPFDDLDWDEMQLRSLVEAVLSFAQST